MLDVIMQQGKVVSLDELPEYSIAVDGFVVGPQIDSAHHRLSFDHHGPNVLRFCTTSACQQSWTAVMLGLDSSKFTAFCNHADIDTSAAIYCLKNPERCQEPLVAKLISAIGMSDCHGGSISINGLTKIIEWIALPETESRRCKDYSKLSNEGLLTIMESILARIELYVNGEASIEVAKVHPHDEYKVLHNENGWVMVSSESPHIYSQLYRQGFDRIVLVRNQDDGSLAVSIAKRSDFIDQFPLIKIYAALNELEPGWGGSSSIGGAPRNPDGSRSRLSIEEIKRVINECILGKLVIEERPVKKRPAKKAKKVSK